MTSTTYSQSNNENRKKLMADFSGVITNLKVQFSSCRKQMCQCSDIVSHNRGAIFIYNQVNKYLVAIGCRYLTPIEIFLQCKITYPNFIIFFIRKLLMKKKKTIYFMIHISIMKKKTRLPIGKIEKKKLNSIIKSISLNILIYTDLFLYICYFIVIYVEFYYQFLFT